MPTFLNKSGDQSHKTGLFVALGMARRENQVPVPATSETAEKNWKARVMYEALISSKYRKKGRLARQ